MVIAESHWCTLNNKTFPKSRKYAVNLLVAILRVALGLF